MEYVLGGLVGIVATAAFLFLFSKFGTNLNDSIERSRALMAYWQTATEEHKAQVAHLKRIADAVDEWKGRYTRRKKGKVEMKGAENDGNQD